ncbi:MAG: hypothetical protein IIC67_05265 [Thaumarchaeota archaeon]|nr:hypothetical protein [Nitrososphaerota archaeon]
MSAILTDFESNIMRLLIVALRFQGIHHEFPNQMKPTKDALLVRGILREYAVIQLHNFMIIRKDLLKNPKFQKFDDAIKPLIQPILDHEIGIKQMRHNYIAHIQEKGRKFKVMMNDIVLKYNLPTDWATWNYFSGLAWFYFGLVDNNFKKEADKAEKKYNAKVGQSITVSSGFKMKDVSSQISKILLPLSVELDSKGFKTTFSNKDLSRLKKKYPLTT